MALTIRSLFETRCTRVKMSRSFIYAIKQYRLSFFNRNEDHFNFFNSNLLGVYPIRFRTIDRRRWFEEIIEVDEVDIREELKNIEALDPEWIRANDVMNLSCVWLLWKCYNSTLSKKQKEEGLHDIVLIFQYKLLSSIMAHFFPYPADENVARATYESMSRKFEIKKFGSWQSLLDNRTRAILQYGGIHYNAYSTMESDEEVIRMVNDVQQRLREIVKKYTALFNRVKTENLSIANTKESFEIDGEVFLRDNIRNYVDYTRYLKDIITDKPTFIRQEIVNVITNMVYNVNEQHLTQLLEYISDNYGIRNERVIDTIIENIMYHAYQFISENRGIMVSSYDISGLISRLRNIYSASRLSDETLLKVRDGVDRLIKQAVPMRNKSFQSPLRVSFQIYLVLRAFSSKYYRN